jgi:hypothetical protein
MVVFKGEMDHFIPIAVLKSQGRDHLAYAWSNFRYAEGDLNQRKHDHLILDPFTVQDHWFKILLPSLQLVLTERVPKRVCKKAEFTLERLDLQSGAVVIRYRQLWFEMYRERRLDLEA